MLKISTLFSYRLNKTQPFLICNEIANNVFCKQEHSFCFPINRGAVFLLLRFGCKWHCRKGSPIVEAQGMTVNHFGLYFKLFFFVVVVVL